MDPAAEDDLFELASNYIKTHTQELTTSQLLEIYGLYKQATVGTCQNSRPPFYDRKGREKHDAWSRLKSMSSNEAKHKYIEIVQELNPDFSTDKSGQETWVTVSTPLNTESNISDLEKTVFDHCKEGNLPELEKIIRQNPRKLNEHDETGLALIHWAADRGNLQVLTWLNDKQVELNARDGDGQTALHYASSCDYLKCVEFLLKVGADPLLEDNEGVKAEDLASDPSIRQLFKQFKDNV